MAATMTAEAEREIREWAETWRDPGADKVVAVLSELDETRRRLALLSAPSEDALEAEGHVELAADHLCIAEGTVGAYAGGGQPSERDAALEACAKALVRLRPILNNSREAFLDPPSYHDTGLNAYRFEGLASGCYVGLEVLDTALARLAAVSKDTPAPVVSNVGAKEQKA